MACLRTVDCAIADVMLMLGVAKVICCSSCVQLCMDNWSTTAANVNERVFMSNPRSGAGSSVSSCTKLGTD